MAKPKGRNLGELAWDKLFTRIVRLRGKQKEKKKRYLRPIQLTDPDPTVSKNEIVEKCSCNGRPLGSECRVRSSNHRYKDRHADGQACRRVDHDATSPKPLNCTREEKRPSSKGCVHDRCQELGHEG